MWFLLLFVLQIWVSIIMVDGRVVSQNLFRVALAVQCTFQTPQDTLENNIYIPRSRSTIYSSAVYAEMDYLVLKPIYKTGMLPFVTFCRWNSRRRLDKFLGTKESLSGMKYIWCSPSSARRPCQSRRSKHSLKNRPSVWYRCGRTPARLWSSSG